jgi:hypothetical protein
VRGKGSGVWRPRADEVGAGWCGGVRPVVFGLGVVIVGRARAVGRWDRRERGRRLSEGAVGGSEDAVVVDDGNVRVGRGFGLGEEESRSQQERSDLGAEDAASSGHRNEACGRKSNTMVEKGCQRGVSTAT